MSETPRTPPRAPLLSIIVAVFNVGGYLRQCLDSIAAQTIADYEVLLVDDKSADGSLEICREYAQSRPHFQVIALPEHTPGGCGAPSNIGLKAARGRYIGFVDGDDYARPEMFECLLENALKHDADISLCDHARFYMAENRVQPCVDRAIFLKLNEPAFALLPEAEQKKLFLRLSTPPWLKIYRRSFLEDKRIAFPEGPFVGEDVPFHWFSILQARSIVWVDRPLITHRHERPGQTVEHPERNIEHIVLTQAIIKAWLVENNLYDALKYNYIYKTITRLCWAVHRVKARSRRDLLSQYREMYNVLSMREVMPYRVSNGMRFHASVRHYCLAAFNTDNALFIIFFCLMIYLYEIIVNLKCGGLFRGYVR